MISVFLSLFFALSILQPSLAEEIDFNQDGVTDIWIKSSFNDDLKELIFGPSWDASTKILSRNTLIPPLEKFTSTLPLFSKLILSALKTSSKPYIIIHVTSIILTALIPILFVALVPDSTLIFSHLSYSF